jgi:hypothetical protein
LVCPPGTSIPKLWRPVHAGARAAGIARDAGGEAAAPARGALDVEAAAGGDDAIAGDAQAQSHALREAAIGLAAVEGLQDARPVVRWDAGAGVADLDPNGVRVEAGADGYRASGRHVLVRW